MDPDYRQDLIEKVEIIVHMKGERPSITMTAVPDGPYSRIVWLHEPEFSDADNDTFLRMVPTGRHDFTLFLEKVRVLNGDEERARTPQGRERRRSRWVSRTDPLPVCEWHEGCERRPIVGGDLCFEHDQQWRAEQ